MKIGGSNWITQEEAIVLIMRERQYSREEARVILDIFMEDHPKDVIEEPDA
jgi:hypothetical protein